QCRTDVKTWPERPCWLSHRLVAKTDRVPLGAVRLISRSPMYVESMLSTSSTDSIRMSASRCRGTETPAALLSGTAMLNDSGPVVAVTSGPTLVHAAASATSAAASTAPKPNLWLTHRPAPLSFQSESFGSFLR